ncbi:hypothetical protein [Porphyromonas endodontalis]
MNKTILQGWAITLWLASMILVGACLLLAEPNDDSTMLSMILCFALKPIAIYMLFGVSSLAHKAHKAGKLPRLVQEWFAFDDEKK